MTHFSLKLVAYRICLCSSLLGTVAVTAQPGHTAPFRAITAEARPKALKLNQDGTTSVKEKKYEQAKVFFKQAIQLDPDLSDAYENLALLAILAGDDVSAEETARRLLLLDPRSYNGRLIAGVAAINQQQFERARDSLAPLITPDGKLDPLASTAYAVALDETGRKTEASRLKRSLAKSGVEDRDAVLAGQIFRQALLRRNAQRWLEACIERDNTAARADMLYTLAGMYAEQGRTSDASTLYLRVLSVEPNNVNALIQLSEIELANGDKDKGLSHLYAAKTQANKDVPSLLHFSQICMQRHMFIDASEALRKVVAQDPYTREAWYELGLAQYRIGETDSAGNAFNSALALDENDEWSRIGLGVVLMSSSRHAEAAREFKRVLVQDPKSSAAYYYLAQAERGQQDVLVLQDELKKAVLYAGQDARPLAALGQLQFEHNDLASARQSFDKALELDPKSALTHYYMASLLRAEGEGEKAKKEIELFHKYHDEENEKGIVGLAQAGRWDYAGFLPSR